ncbi:MAG: GNAT family N-acetyltransferase [Thermomicrobiales bacterium]
MNDPRYTIREYRGEDLEPAMAAWRNANALAHPFLSEEYVSQVEREIRDTYLPKSETYVLEEEGEVLGFIALAGNEIGGLFLEPSKHGKGYGRAMVDHAVAIEGPLRVEVFRDNQIGCSFYERYGFESVADERHEPSGAIVRKMAMAGA